MPAVDDVVNESSDSEIEDRSTANLAQMKIDEWLNFKLDKEVRIKVGYFAVLIYSTCPSSNTTWHFKQQFAFSVYYILSCITHSLLLP